MISQKLSKAKFAVLALILGFFVANEVQAAYPSLPTFNYNYMVISGLVVQTADGSQTLFSELGNRTQYQIGQTSSPITLEAGQQYRFSFSGLYWYSGSCCYPMAAYAWIDWNGNEDFGDPGERVLDWYYMYGTDANIGSSSLPWTYFTVPESAQGLTIRLRIAAGYYYYGYPPYTGAGSYYGDAGDLVFFIPAPPSDAGITGISQPPAAFTKGTQNIAVMLHNYENRELTSCRIVWRIDEGLPTESSNTYSWTGSLAQDEEEEVVVGTFDFNENRTYTIDAFTEAPNDDIDIDPSNDRALRRFVAPALSPTTYYIGNYGSSSNTFSDIQEATTYLSQAGIIGDGTLRIVFPNLDLGDPPYNGPIYLSNYPSIGNNNVLITSESGNPGDVTVYFEPDATDMYLLTFNTVDNVTIEGITFAVDDVNGYSGIMNFQSSQMITVDNCIFNNKPSAPANNRYISLNIGEGYDITVTNNVFNGGAYAINEASFCPRKINISNNTFNNVSYNNILLYGTPDGNPCSENNIIVENNTFVSNGAPYGIMSTNGTEIKNNSFTGFSGSNSNSAIIYITNTDPVNFTTTTTIDNNQIFSNLVDINAIYGVNVPKLSITNNHISVTDETLAPPNFSTNSIYLSGCGNSNNLVYIKGNQIEYNQAGDGYAVNLLNSYVLIVKNDIDLPGAGNSSYNIYANNTNGYIANNQIGAVNSTNINFDNCSLNFYYNTVATESSTNPVIRINGGSNSIMRNIFQNNGTNKVIVASNAGFNTIDENNYFTNGSVFGQWSGLDVADLAEWQTTSGQDANSISQEISFVDFATFDLGLNTFTESMVFDDPLSFSDPNIEAEVQGTDYNGNTRYSYFMGSENVIPEIFITSQPQSVMDCLGATGHFFNVNAYVTKGVQTRFEWFKDGQSLTELYTDPTDDWAEKATLYVEDLPFADENGGLTFEAQGVYYCKVKGSGAEPKYTDEVILNTLAPAEITRQPENQRANKGGEVMLMVEAHIVADEGMDDVYYQPEIQWYRGTGANQVALENDLSVDGHYSGVKSNILTIRNITDNEFGDDYWVELKGQCGTLVSQMVSVMPFPEVFILESPYSQSICEGSPVTFSVDAQASDAEATIEYQWRKDGVAIEGATESTYTIDAVTADDLGMYDCVVTVLPGGDTEVSEAAELTMKLAPEITTQPADQTLAVGDPFVLFVNATGEEPLAYQWYKDDVIIDGATSSTFGKSSVTVEDAGVYTCEVSNVCGTVMSDPANVTVSDGGYTDVADGQLNGYVLSENTPNPFNDQTVIRYYAPQPTAVRLSITDVYGKELQVLVDGKVVSGWNEVKVNASTLSSGVYYYTLKAGNNVITQKMVVVK